MTPAVDVSVAVLERADGRVLLARRPPQKVYAGYWEFPGGKVEPGETTAAALAREVHEELGVEVRRADPWITNVFTYPHATVRLHFFRVRAWHGEPQAREHDGLSWEDPRHVALEPLLPANGPVLRGLMLPAEYAITQAGALGTDAFLARLEARLAAGLRMVQVRELAFGRDDMQALAFAVIARARPVGARVLVSNDVALAHMVGADGVHLTARQVATMESRPDLPLVGASCHSRGELDAAVRLGADFAVLGAVRPTASHPDAAVLGWDAFAAIARDAPLPVYAIGGLQRADLDAAWRRGAHGIAMIRGAWSP
jgi:8-oxo-dGTP diphosphatase